MIIVNTKLILKDTIQKKEVKNIYLFFFFIFFDISSTRWSKGSV